MVKQWRNEDIIAPSDAQRWEDGIEQSQQNNEQNSINLKKHEENKNNPHGVTAGQTGAYTKEEVDSLDSAILEVAKTHIDDHAKKKNNPHGVTASQIGVYTKAEADENSQLTLTAAKDYADTKNEEANAFTTQEIEKSKLEIQSGNVATASKLQTARKIAGNDFDGTIDIAISANDVGAYTKAESDKKLKEEIATSNDNLKVATRNYLLDSQVERTSGNEFLNHTSWDLAPLIDEHGMDREYTISFDLKSAVPGSIRVYSQNGSGVKYDIGQHPINATTEYKRFTVSFKPKKAAGFDTETRSLLAFFGTYDTGRIPTVRNVLFGLGNVAGDWMPHLDELAKQESLEETNQKVKTLEENTINLTNQFPDFDFSKQTPRPIGESGVTIAYDNQGVVFNNPTNNQGRASWTSPPMGLMVGKTYNVSMRVNVGVASIGKTFIVGTAHGENFTITATGQSDFWVNGTIGLTTWTGFSIWLPPHTSIRVRELYIHEANTDITTARIERIEQAVIDTVDIQHATGNALTVVPKWDCMAEVNVQLAGWGLDGKKWVVGLNTPAGTTQVVQGVGVLEGSNLISSHVSYTSIFTELKQGQSYTFRRETSEGQIGQAENASLIAKLYRTR